MRLVVFFFAGEMLGMCLYVKLSVNVVRMRILPVVRKHAEPEKK